MGRAFAACVAVLMICLAGAGCESDDGPLGPGPNGPIGALGDDDGIPGSGIVASETRQVAGFTEIWFGSEGTVKVTVGEAPSVEVAADDNLLQYLTTQSSAGRLEVATADGTNIAPSVPPVFTIVMPELRGFELAGVGSVRIDPVETYRLELGLSGVGDITIGSIAVDELAVEMRGVGTLSLAGTAQTQQAFVGGVTAYAAAELATLTAEVEAAGEGSATLWVSDLLTITAAGTSSVEYWGSPVVEETITELGSVVHLGSK